MVTFQFVPHHEVAQLSSPKRIEKLLDIVKEEKIVVMEGRLRKEEETRLIRKTMEEITPQFKGIELSVIYPDAGKQDMFDRIRATFANMLLGDRQGLTVIGPVSIVKRITQNPNRIELLTQEKYQRRKSKSKKRKK